MGFKHKKIKKSQVAVDPRKWGINDNTYDVPPKYYENLDFQCPDCGKEETWFAEDQKHWYEVLGKTINSTAKYCRECRAKIKDQKRQQKKHMETMAKQPKHPNERFFKKR